MNNTQLVPGSDSHRRQVDRANVGEDNLSWSWIAGLLRRRWPLVAAALVASLAVAAGYLTTTAPVYEAGTSLLVEADEYNLPEVVKRVDRENDINTQLEVLRSARLSQQVARDLGLQLVVRAPSRIPRSQILRNVSVADSSATGAIELHRVNATRFSALTAAGVRLDSVFLNRPAVIGPVTFTLTDEAARFSVIELEVETLRAAATNLLEELTVVRPDRSGNVIVVRHQHSDPEIAGGVPNQLTDHYIENRLEMARAKVRKAVQFLRQEADSIKRQLFAVEEDLQNFRRREGIVSIQDEAAAEVVQSAELRNARTKIEAERAALQQLITEAGRDSSPEGTPFRRLTAFPTLIDNPVVSELLSTLIQLEDKRSDLLLRRTARDPDVQANQRQIDQVDQQLSGMTLTYLNGLKNQVGSFDAALRTRAGVASAIPRKSMQEERLSRRPKLLSEVSALVETRLQEARIAEGAADPGVTIIDRSTTPDVPVWPRRGLILAVAIAAGLLLGGALAWIRDGADRSVRTRTDVLEVVNVPVLGLVPRATRLRGTDRTDGRRRLLPRLLEASDQSLHAANEAYAWLETALLLNHAETRLRTVALTSPLARDGKTVNAINLALTLARRGRRILLIDADLRRGRIHQVLGLAKGPGLAEVLRRDVNPSDAIEAVPVDDATAVYAMPAGECVEHPSELLGSGTMKELLDLLSSQYDMIICDTPPINLVSDALLIGRVVDGVVLVIRAGVTDTAALTEAARHLREGGAPFLGVLLNDIDLQRDGSYDNAYRYLEQAAEYASAGRP